MDVMIRRKRVFGGAEGMLMRKRSTITTTKTTARHHPLATWDDVKCRPVYEPSTASSSSSSAYSSSEDYDVFGGGTPENEESSPGCEPSTTSKDASPMPHDAWSWQHQPKSTTTRSRNGAFGSRNRRIILESTPIISATNEDRPLEHDDAPCKEANGSDDFEDEALVAATETKRNLSFPDSVRRILKTNGEQTNKISPEMFDFTDDENDEGEHATPVTKQPSFLTSLTVAKKFFVQLDAQPLRLTTAEDEDDHDEPAAQSRAPGRTRRRLLAANNPSLAAEYQQYCDACGTVGVDPLSQDMFVQQRCLFNATIYDGFLDE